MNKIQNNGLMTIYLYDSYLKGSLTKFEIYGGHTNLTGQNGAGKTSALNLIPVFYGARPDRLIDRSANKLNFTDYYLPHERSLLIYEYLTPNGACCAVFYRHPTQERLCVKFIHGRAEQTLLSEENLKFHAENNSAQELFSHLFKQGIHVSIQIDQQNDYKAIITNDRARLKANPKLRDVATLFSLGGNKLEIKHVGALTQITSNKINLLDSFKQMLIDLYLDSEKSVTKFKISHDYAEITNELRVLYRLQKEKPKIQMGIERRGALLNTYHELFAHNDHVVRWKADNHTQIQSLENQRRELKLKLERDTQDLRQHLFENSTLTASIEGKLKGVKAHLRRIEDTESFYKQSGIIRKQQEFNSIAIYQQNMLDAKQYLSDIEKNYQEIKNKFSQLEFEILEQKDRALMRNYQALENLNQEKDALNNKLQKLIAGLIEQKNIDEQNFNQANEHERSSYENKIARWMARIETVSKLEPSEEEQNSAYLIDLDLKKVSIQNKEKEITQHYIDQSSLRDEFERIRENLRIAKNRLNQLSNERDVLNELIHSNDTVLHFLNQNTEINWREHIAKVIHPKLLSRKDLSPYWDLELENSTSVFGLNFDLSQLSVPPEADSLDIQQARLVEIEVNIVNLHKEVDQLESEFNKLHKKRNDAETFKIQLDTELRVLKSELDSIQIEYQAFQERIQTAIQQRKEEAERFLALTQSQFNELKANIEQQRKIINDRFSKDQQRIYDAFEHDKSIVLEKQASLKQQNQSIEDDYQQKQNDLKTMYEHELQQRGFDVLVQRNAKERYEQLRDDYERIKSYQDELEKYLRWTETEYKNKAYLLEQITVYEKEHDQLKLKYKILSDKLESVNILAQHESNKLQDAIIHLESENKKLNALLLTLENIFSDLQDNDFKNELTLKKPINFEMLCRHVDDLLSRRNNQSKELKHSVSMIISIIRQDTDLELYKLWKSRMDEYGSLTGVAYDLQSMHEIEEMLYHDIPSREALIRIQFSLKAYALRDYAEAVLSFNQKLSKVSRDLNYKTNSTNPFPALTDIETKLVSVLDGLDVYEKLKAYVRDLQEADLQDSAMLPSERLIDTYERTYRALESAKIDTNDIQTLVRLRISYKENGRSVAVNNDSDLAQGSSTGLSRLIVIIIFTALTRDMCPDLNTAIHLPLDEIGQFDAQNSSRLFQLMQDQNIHLICAQPGLTIELSKHFTHKHDIDRTFGIRKFVIQKTCQNNPLLTKKMNSDNTHTDTIEG